MNSNETPLMKLLVIKYEAHDISVLTWRFGIMTVYCFLWPQGMQLFIQWRQLYHKLLSKPCLLPLSPWCQKPQRHRNTPVSTALCWSPHHLRVVKWWLCQWSFPPSECCHWPLPTWLRWSKCADRWGCSLGLCSRRDGRSRTSLTLPAPATAKEDRQEIVRLSGRTNVHVLYCRVWMASC